MVGATESAWSGQEFFRRVGTRILRCRDSDFACVLKGKRRAERAFLGYMIVSAIGGCHADRDALENRARPPFPDAPTAGIVFACSEHAVGRAGCIGTRLVGKVKDHSACARMG